MNRTLLVILLGVVLAILLLAGCGKKDKVVGPDFPTPTPSPIRSTPQNAILYYKAAWENRDSTRIDSVLALGYEGSSSDLSGTLTFTKADEVHIMSRIQQDPNLFAVSVNLGASATWFRQIYASDPPEWVALEIPNADVRLYTTTEDLVANSAIVMEFKLEPTTPAPTSPTDTLWSIVRWTENAN